MPAPITGTTSIMDQLLLDAQQLHRVFAELLKLFVEMFDKLRLLIRELPELPEPASIRRAD